MLLDGGAEVNDGDELGRAPLHLITRYGNAGAAKILIGHGATVDAIDKKGKTTLHWASIWCFTFYEQPYDWLWGARGPPPLAESIRFLLMSWKSIGRAALSPNQMIRRVVV